MTGRISMSMITLQVDVWLANDICSLGPPPYNGGVFYGNADTHFEITRATNAVVWTQTAMEVPITSQT